eukprot:SAG31_NODE_37782_length_301_cov_1.034653_1_plen_83_part_01
MICACKPTLTGLESNLHSFTEKIITTKIEADVWVRFSDRFEEMVLPSVVEQATEGSACKVQSQVSIADTTAAGPALVSAMDAD